jgi:hypothetical protein
LPGVRIAIAGAIAMALIAASGCGGNRPPRDPAEAAGPADPTQRTARRALIVAEAAASSWMRDAQLIYLENDAAVGLAGDSPRWGFLFHSELIDSWHNVAVENGRVVHQGPLAFPFAAPDLPAEWIDSEEAVKRAEAAGGRAFRERSGGDLEHAMLTRGVFTAWDGPPTWTVVYRSPDRSEYAIVVNAADGSILSRFEG